MVASLLMLAVCAALVLFAALVLDGHLGGGNGMVTSPLRWGCCDDMPPSARLILTCFQRRTTTVLPDTNL